MTVFRSQLLTAGLLAVLIVPAAVIAQDNASLQDRRASIRRWNQQQQSRLLEQMRCVDQAGSSEALNRCQQRFHQAMPGYHGRGGCWH